MKTIYIPAGTKNIAPIFGSVLLPDVAEYFLQLKDAENNTLVTTTTYRIIKICDDAVRIHFLNGVGAIDAVAFETVGVQNQNESGRRQQAPTTPLQKDKHGIHRIDVRAFDRYVVRTASYSESDTQWLTELLNSPLAWIEWTGTQGQPDNYLPIVIVDSNFDTRKVEDRYVYEVEVQFIMSHPKFILR